MNPSTLVSSPLVHVFSMLGGCWGLLFAVEGDSAEARRGVQKAVWSLLHFFLKRSLLVFAFISFCSAAVVCHIETFRRSSHPSGPSLMARI